MNSRKIEECIEDEKNKNNSQPSTSGCPVYIRKFSKPLS